MHSVVTTANDTTHVSYHHKRKLLTAYSDGLTRLIVVLILQYTYQIFMLYTWN